MKLARSGHVLILIGWVAVMMAVEIPPAIAAPCTTTPAHNVCLVSIKRSAKQYWEYRAAVIIDGVARPDEVYNCRDRQRVKVDGRIVPFEPGGAGEVICKKLYRPARSPIQ